MPLANRQTNSAAGSSCNINIAQASGNNRYLVALLTENHWDSANHAANATINGVNGTVITTSGGSPDGMRTRAWRWLDADLPSSSGNYAITVDGNDGNGRQLSAIYHTGAKQAAPADITTLVFDYRGEFTDTLTADSGMTTVVATVWNFNTGNTVTLGAGQVALVNTNQGNGLHTHSYLVDSGAISHDFSAYELNASVAFAIEPAAGGTPATLSTPTDTGTTTTQTTIGCTTDTVSGTLYAVLTNTASHNDAITAQQVRDGLRDDGVTAAQRDDSVSVTDTTPEITFTGLTQGTTYHYAFVQETAAGLSNVLKGTVTMAADGRTITFQLLNQADGTPLANTERVFWTKSTVNGAVVDGGTNGISATTNGTGFVTLSNLTIAAGAGFLQYGNPGNNNQIRIVPATFVQP